MMPGTLYVVATPIGNLEDMTYRAVRILGEADLIACEDTRQTRKLLDHYGIQKPAISYHEHNEAERTAELIERLNGGTTIALVTDAGTPLVSDPGYRLVKAAVENRITVYPIPGASAAMTALAASGLPTDSFHFGGFLPPKPTWIVGRTGNINAVLAYPIIEATITFLVGSMFLKERHTHRIWDEVEELDPQAA